MRKLRDNPYPKLLTNISRFYEEARQAIVLAYWEIGRLIIEGEQDKILRAAYGSGLLKNLSTDLTKRCGKGFSVDNLENMRRFYVTYPKSETSRKLKWSHYVALCRLSNMDSRRRFEVEAEREGISIRELKRRIKNEKFRIQLSETDPKTGKKLTPKRGELYIYRVKEITVGGILKRNVLDCGFCVYHDTILDSYLGLKAGDVVRSIKRENDFQLEPVDEQIGTKSLYTYKAFVEKVIDADTIRVYIPCGFGMAVREKLRLRGVNAPEARTPEGERATQFVVSCLRNTEFVVVKSYWRDKYDRYLVDLFYLANEADADIVSEEGNFLNQELLDKGHAQRVEG